MRTTSSRMRQLDAAADDGLSLAELLVAMMISGILLALVGTMFVNVTRITTNSNATTQRSGAAANVVNEVSRVIRTAANNPVSTSPIADPAIVSATPTALTLYSFVDSTNLVTPAPSKVVFRFDTAGKLIEDRVVATKSSDGKYWVFSGASTSRTIGSSLQNPAGTDPFFLYLDADYNPITPGTGGLTLAQRGQVAFIRVTVRIDNNPSTGSDPIVIVNTVGMPNLKNTRTDS
ncbi:hypothetical protein BH09ACT5_BH09ACT5_18700 [soil metagenome]